jgi:hypothetical protein
MDSLVKGLDVVTVINVLPASCWQVLRLGQQICRQHVGVPDDCKIFPRQPRKSIVLLRRLGWKIAGLIGHTPRR